MLNVLIVDDEYYAVEAIVYGVRWAELNITGVFEAHSVAAAQQQFLTNDIHILIADIEMPGEDGLELLEWVNAGYPGVKTVFLTAHSNFAYAQKALKLGSFDYIVKPVDKTRLSAVIHQAAELIRKEQGFIHTFNNYEHYLSLWSSNRPLLKESFWQQLAEQQLSVNESDLPEYFELYGIHFPPGKPVTVILFHIDYWEQEFSFQDRKVLQYAMKNAASEIMDGGEGIQVFCDKFDRLLVLLPTGDEDPEIQAAANRCLRFIDACRTFFYSQLSCYISIPVSLIQLAPTYRTLLEMERSNVTRLHPVHWQNRVSIFPRPSIEVTWLSELQALLEAGNVNETNGLLENMFAGLEHSEGTTHETLQTIYFGILFIMSNLAQKQGFEAGSLYGMVNMNQHEVPRTLPLFKKWITEMIETILSLQTKGRERNQLIDKIHLFIEQHLCEEFSREDIANHVHLNPVYVSRLYKKETGVSITDYILEKRMERAQKYLLETSYKVTSIMEMVGYQSFSHFTQMFKKVYRMTPQEYRKYNKPLTP